MGKILEALAEDNLCINPATFKGNSEYRKAINAIYDSAEELENKLNGEEKKLFEQFRDTQSNESIIYNLDKFVTGFHAGMFMMFAVFSDTTGLLVGKEDNT